MPDAPLEVGLGVGLDEGVDGSNSSGSVVGGGVGRSRRAVGGRSVPPDSDLWQTVYEEKVRKEKILMTSITVKEKHSAGRGAHEGE